MKKAIILFLLGTFISLAQNKQSVTTEKQQVKLKIEFKNRASDSLKVLGLNKFVHKIIVNEKGCFESSFEVTNGNHLISDGKTTIMVYLKNDFDLEMIIDSENKEKMVTYKGIGSKENNYLFESSTKDKAFEASGIFEKEKEEFTKAIELYKNESLKTLDQRGFDDDFVIIVKKLKTEYFQYLPIMYDEVQLLKKLKGTISPSFDYENHKGGKTKLEDLRGKVVYIDVWATWCGPCRAEIPHLKKIEEKFHGKDIAFVSISVDTMKDHEKWQKFVTDNNLGGIQLFADNDWKSQFVKDYNIQGIPRFILLDKEGKVVEASAPRPSSSDLEGKLNALLN